MACKKKSKIIELNGESFWFAVQKQFESNNFINVVHVHDAIRYNPKLSSTLIPFLTKPITISVGLNLKTRFELLSPTAQHNFISLLAFIHDVIPEIPEVLLSNPIDKKVYLSYTETPRLVFSNYDEPQIPIEVNESNEEDSEESEPEPEAILSEPLSTEFFTDIITALVKYPKHSEQIIQQYLPITTFQSFYSYVSGLFSQQIPPSVTILISRYLIKPYLLSLQSSANRLVSDALLLIVSKFPEIFIKEVVQPIFFDPSSKIFVFELLQRLFTLQSFCNSVLPFLFDGRSPSLEAPLKKEALQFLTSAVQRSKNIGSDVQKCVLLHIRTQMGYNSMDAVRPFIFFLKTQELEDEEVRNIAEMMLELVPERMKATAKSAFNK
ncbi:hypothetical protein GPJ56_001966 [Histomonas meleagridis]|uniref:uncharacterized protein n=1 Tax=Histomonas meleagridis TaxID=135588 RepID=UPI00355A6E3A|nr:hypothetical protein GPJ56_001966 [Histomonas meleagridis]KAH0800958.1 hypothetical protein GO595_006274 [Histomonas meleagridis]